MMDRTGVARSLEQIASYLEFTGGNPFRVRAFNTAARSVLGVAGDLEAAIADGSLAGHQGDRPSHSADHHRTGDDRAGVEMLGAICVREVPPGTGRHAGHSRAGCRQDPSDSGDAWHRFAAELEAAARDGRLAALPRFGHAPRTRSSRESPSCAKRVSGASRITPLAKPKHFASAFARLPHILSAHTAGEVRRRCEVVRELVCVLVADVSARGGISATGHHAGRQRNCGGDDERRVTLRFAGGSSVQVVVTPPQNLGAVMVQATGSEAHLAALSEHAARQGIQLRRNGPLAG